MVWFCDITFRKKNIYNKMEIDETDGKDGHIYIYIVLKNWWNTGNINRGER